MRINSLLHKVEGFRSEPYLDNQGNVTIGTGINLQNKDNQARLAMMGYDPDKVMNGQQKMSPHDLNHLDEMVQNKSFEDTKKIIGADMVDFMPVNKQEALHSLVHQSKNNVGPNLKSYLAKDDQLNVINEIMANTNVQNDPGLQLRRLHEAMHYAGPLDFSSATKILTSEQKDKILNNLNNIQNEPTRNEALRTYGPYLKQIPSNFQKLFQPEIQAPISPNLTNKINSEKEA